MVLESVLGGLVGGVFRLVPELMKWLDRKADRAHELAMFDKQLEADRQRSQNHLQEIQAAGQIQLDASGLDALKEALRGQAEMAVAAGGWIAGLSASVRPVVTYWLLLLYAAAKTVGCVAMLRAGADWTTVIAAAYVEADMALLSGVINFWFLDRVIRKQAP